MSRLHIAALGSSFAAGPGIEPLENKAAMRSSQNYAHLLSAKLDSDLTDLTVSGATLLNVLNTPQRLGFSKFAPQLSKLPATADIVTLTAGGNDLGYVGGMLFDSALATLPRFLQNLARFVFSIFGSTARTLAPEEVADRMVAVIDRIHEIAPKATIFLVEYIAILGSATRPRVDTPLDESKVRHYRDVGHVLQEAYEQATRTRPEVKLIPVGSLSQGHELGCKEAWVDGYNFKMFFRGQVPYHPNLECHKAIAEILYENITSARRV